MLRSQALLALLIGLLLLSAGCGRPDITRVPSARGSQTRDGSPAAGTPSEPITPAAIRYVFPVQPANVASYGHAHHDYPATDVFAPCGTAVVSPVDGLVDEVSTEDRWNPTVNDGATRGGRFFTVVGDDGVRYYGSHLAEIAGGITPGVRVEAGQALGNVGRSGNARTTPCHLHLGLSPPRGPGDWMVRRGVVYPWPYLDSWRADGQESPAAEVDTWAADHP